MINRFKKDVLKKEKYLDGPDEKIAHVNCLLKAIRGNGTKNYYFKNHPICKKVKTMGG